MARSYRRGLSEVELTGKLIWQLGSNAVKLRLVRTPNYTKSF